MKSITKTFEDLDVWKLAIEVSIEIYKATNKEKFSKDFGLKDQIRRSAVSVASNIAEGFERNNNKQFSYFLKIAKGSCGELRTQILIAKELNYITKEEYIILYEKANYTSRMLSNFIKKIESTII